MSEGSLGKPIVQRDLLGNIIERKIPRSVQAVPEGQITLDKFIEKLNNPAIKIELVRQEETTANKSSLKRRPWGKLIIDKGSRDEHTLAGRYYTPDLGREAWSAPAERRDSYPKITIEEGNIIFQVKDSDVWENGARWTHVIVLARVKKGESPRIKGHGFMRWTDIQKE